MTSYDLFKHLAMVAILIGGCTLGSILFSRWCGGCGATEEKAYQVARSFAEKELGVEGVIDYPWFKDSFVVKQFTDGEFTDVSFIVSSYMEITDSMNKKSKRNYKCELKVSDGNLWTLVSMN